MADESLFIGNVWLLMGTCAYDIICLLILLGGRIMFLKFRKVVLLTLIFIFSFQVFAFPLTNNRLIVNDELLPVQQSTVYDKYTNYISNEVLKNKLGFSVWDNKVNNRIYIKKDDKLLVFQNDQVYLNWKKADIGIYPKRIDGQLFFPASLLKLVFNIPVTWNEQYKFLRLINNQQSVSDSVYNSVYSSVYSSISDSNIIIKYGKELIESMNNSKNINSIDGISPPLNPKKFAYLTFDDGPDPKVTPQVLDVLKKYNVKATFFMLGRYVKDYSKLVKRVYDDGHYIGNHSFSHKKNIYNSLDTFKSEISKTSDLIYKCTGEYPKLFRSPYGYTMNASYKKYLAEEGYKIYNWNVESGDSRGHGVSSEKIISNVANSLGGKRDIVIIMHDGAGHINTALSLESIIRELWKKGYGIKPLTPSTVVNAHIKE
jgi:peptidoglycan/xylan/chitin deacetylase (PgdA/CDA1 family)